ncbi:universal stress protein [Natronosalvus rutilus]|uniref:Universal stress protein n=1 Tax=Natronosalvus rutilus TaxID=2953753 RepID=A0A9E7NEW8_9EURY|nr:universal stress protein [Natronosalvus rutilus]UTF55729.1 universal stress protein [Natronosalvus rutilus]
MAILVVVDDDEDIEGIEETITVAADLAEKYGEELIALNVVSQDEFLKEQQGKTSIADVKPEPIERYESEAADRAREIVGQIIDASTDVTYMGRVADPANGIVKTGRDVDARFIVIGARRQSPIGKAIFGSTTQSVLLSADRPVLTVMEE